MSIPEELMEGLTLPLSVMLLAVVDEESVTNASSIYIVGLPELCIAYRNNISNLMLFQ